MSRNKILVAAVLLAFAPIAGAQTTPPTPTTPPTTTPPPATSTSTTTSVPANRLAGLFTGFLGSRENALSVVNALRTGTSTTIVTTPMCAAPCTTPPTGTSTTIEVPTKPMGWGNVRHALALAQYSLAQAGIANPTPAQISAALNGGTVTTSAGKPVELRGVLTMRASGMGWGNIARAEGTTMGHVNHGLKPFNAVTPPPPTTTTATAPVAPRNIGITSAAGTTSGIVTAGGGASSQQPGRGIVNGNGGGTSGMASGNGNAGGNGHGNGHAGGGGAGVTTAGNGAASTNVTTASNGNGNGRGGGNGNGHGSGNGK